MFARQYQMTIRTQPSFSKAVTISLGFGNGFQVGETIGCCQYTSNKPRMIVFHSLRFRHREYQVGQQLISRPPLNHIVALDEYGFWLGEAVRAWLYGCCGSTQFPHQGDYNPNCVHLILTSLVYHEVCLG